MFSCSNTWHDRSRVSVLTRTTGAVWSSCPYIASYFMIHFISLNRFFNLLRMKNTQKILQNQYYFFSCNYNYTFIYVNSFITSCKICKLMLLKLATKTDFKRLNSNMVSRFPETKGKLFCNFILVKTGNSVLLSLKKQQHIFIL